MRIPSKNNQFHSEYFHPMCGRVNILAFHRMSTPQDSYRMTAGYVKYLSHVDFGIFFSLHSVKFSRYVWLHGDVSFRPTIIQRETRGCLVVAWNGIKLPWEFLTYYFLSQKTADCCTLDNILMLHKMCIITKFKLAQRCFQWRSWTWAQQQLVFYCSI